VDPCVTAENIGSKTQARPERIRPNNQHAMRRNFAFGFACVTTGDEIAAHLAGASPHGGRRP
jgi:hypothetical protein